MFFTESKLHNGFKTKLIFLLEMKVGEKTRKKCLRPGINYKHFKAFTFLQLPLTL